MARAEILDKVKEFVRGQREQDYEKQEDNFATIANLWGAYKGLEFNEKDVVVMMALTKIASSDKRNENFDDCLINANAIANETTFSLSDILSGINESKNPLCLNLAGFTIGQAKHPKRQLSVCVNTQLEFELLRDSIYNVLDRKGRLTVYDVTRLLKWWGSNGSYIRYPNEPMKDLSAYGWKKEGTKLDCDIDAQGKYCIILPYPIKLDSNKEDI